MLDVTALVLEDHAALRRGFAYLDDARDEEALTAVWEGLATLLEVHAACEEEVFYPALLKKGQDAEDETEDAITDHNDIRDAVKEAAKHKVGTDAWWEAVGKARSENSDHIAEEEREALPDFRKNASDELRAERAVAWLAWRNEHERAVKVSSKDKDAEEYIAANS